MQSSSYIHLADADQTSAAGAALGQALLQIRMDHPFIVHLNGELGAGKTTFVRGLLHAMGHADAVRSPTYTLIEPYEFARDAMQLPVLQVIHMDLYRLADAAQLDELGVRDMLLPDTVLLIEWAARAGTRLPPADLAINLVYPDEQLQGRNLQWIASSAAANQLLQHMQPKYSTGP